MIWVTADQHFNHENMLTTFCPARQGWCKDVNHMNRVMVEKINAVVKPTDELYFVGDFSLRGNNDLVIPALLGQIWCKHTRLVYGNHDKHRHGKFFEQAYELVDVKWNHQRFTLCHYPMAAWRRGAMMLHGHWHGTGPEMTLRLDVGVDGPRGGEFRGPWSLEEVKEHIEDRDRKNLIEKSHDERMRELDKNATEMV